GRLGHPPRLLPCSPPRDRREAGLPGANWNGKAFARGGTGRWNQYVGVVRPTAQEGPPMSDEPDNPFKGTPFEAMFQQFSGAAGAGGTPDLNAIFAQVQQLLSGSTDGKPVNWDLAKDIARKTVSAAGDRSITPTDSDRVADAVRLAEHWLDEA